MSISNEFSLGGAGEVGGGGVWEKQAEPSNPWLLKFYSCPTRKSSVFFTSEIKKKKDLMGVHNYL